ncbi:hypothetical protein BDF21DRAFT_425010 [Thamnidium elegans]|nr:hypothetical protein BDF21DRAFT_425010 [Thamnidium elegans]
MYKNIQPCKSHLYSIYNITLTKMKLDMDDKNKHCTSCNRTYSTRNSYMRHLAEVHDMEKVDIKQENTD